MRREEVIRILQEHRDELTQQYGVKSLALFGSVARNDATDSSDVDLLVEFDDRPVGLFHLGGLQRRLQDILGVEKLDLVMRRAIFPALRDNILGDAVDVLGTEMGASH